MRISRQPFQVAAIMAVVCCLIFLSTLTGLGQSGPPMPPIIWLNSYSFLQTNWASDLGYLPISYTNLISVSNWGGNALFLNRTNDIPAYLRYRVEETNGYLNFDMAAGAVYALVVPNWASSNSTQHGHGPGSDAYVVAAGDWSTGSPNGFWGIYINSGGTNIYFTGVSNSVTTNYVSAPISWSSNSIHLISLLYSTNTMLFLDGKLAATGGAVKFVPNTNTWTNGFYVGSDDLGYEQFRGDFLYLEFDTTNVTDLGGTNYFNDDWSYMTNQYYTWLDGGGAGGDSMMGGSGPLFIPPPPIEATNYSAYNEFYLTISNTSTLAYVTVSNTLSNLTYQVQTNANLANTNGWHVWKTFLATNSVTTMPSISLSVTNPLCFRTMLVWSTCTNYNPALPDWWAMLYFGSTTCVNPVANPADDGIDNWDKYVLGLNPNVAYVSQLVVNPPGGDYVSMPSIAIFSLTGATIKYTTNGSIPSATNGFTASSGVPLTNIPPGNFTLKAWESGIISNVPAVATYTIFPAPPVLSLAEGVYNSGTSLQITCATTNAVVRYTTNGVDPTTSSAQIWPTNSITLMTNVTVKAAAWLSGTESPVASAAYVINIMPTGPPSNDNFSNAITFAGASGTVSGTTWNATLEPFETNQNYNSYDDFACQDGDSVWYKFVAPSNGTLYFNCYASALELGAWAFPGNTPSNPTNLVPVGLDYGGLQNLYANGISYYIMPVTNGISYYISASLWHTYSGPFDFSWQYLGATIEPLFRPDVGTYTNAQSVQVIDNDANAIIYFTLNGSTPTTNSETIVSGSFLTINTNTTLKAMALRAGLEDSAIKSAVYTINPSSTNSTLTASAPILSPGNTNFASSLAVTLTCTNTFARIYYTQDGTVPSITSPYVVSNGTVTLTNSTLFTASTWVTNMNFSPMTIGWYAKNGVDSSGDGIPDSSALAIGADPFVLDANVANPNPFAHGLDNMQVYQNQSVLLANNYSTLSDGIPDWWLVQNGYSVTTASNTIGVNGQTLLTSYQAGLNPNSTFSRTGYLPQIDFHVVHGPSNTLVVVMDNVSSDMAGYLVYCTEADPGNPLYGQAVLEEFPANTAITVSGEQWGRFFQLTNNLPAGDWAITVQGVNSNGIWSAVSSNAFGRYQEYLSGTGGEFDTWNQYVGATVAVPPFTNNTCYVKEAQLAQWLRAESDVWYALFGMQGTFADVAPDGPVLYDNIVAEPVVSETSWGTLTFQNNASAGTYSAASYASYFTAICSTGDIVGGCVNYYDYFNVNGIELTPLQFTYDVNLNPYFIMPNPSFNPAGLEYSNVTYRIGEGEPITLEPGQSNAIPNTNFTFEAALNTETPTFQTVNYYFDGRQYPLIDDEGGNNVRSSPPAEGTAFDDGWAYYLFGSYYPASVTNPVIVAQVGRPVNLQAWAQVFPVRPNGTVLSNVPCWIDQDFSQAYLCNPATGDVPRTSTPNYNGKMEINTNEAVTTGILSHNLNYTNYNGALPTRQADFTPTQIGKVIVTTQPDPDGYYGELTIYVIDMQVDANHDGVMDDRDLTSLHNPMQFWVNNNFDRYVPDSDDGVSYDDDVATNDPTYSPCPGAPGSPTADCNYRTSGQFECIPTVRDLEDYAQLWIPGFSNLMANLPTNYTASLLWRNNAGAAVRLFLAAETNGGTNYLFNESVGTQQTNYLEYPCYGYVLPDLPLGIGVEYRLWQYEFATSDHFIFCGSASGNDELVLQIQNPWGGVAGEASVFLNLKNIKQMYERWSVGENLSVAPNNIATNAGDDGFGSFQYPYDPSLDSTTPYILYVHGWNMPTWEKDRWAETAYKRLYWQGYQGRLGVYRWPTGNGFVGIATMATNIAEKDNYDLSEYQAWQSATGLLNKLTALDIQYPGQVYMLAHSMGNVVAGEALRLSGTTQLVNTYVASQAAITAHTYEANITNYSFSYPPWSYSADTPNIYGNWFATNNGNSAGQIISFYNVNDFALQRSVWQLDQLFKPDQDVLEGSQSWNYGYSGSTNDPAPWNHFYKQNITGSPSNSFNIVTNILNRYEVMALAAQPYTTALGATPGVTNLVTLNLTTVWPFPDPLSNNYASHFWHSAQFRGDYWMEDGYWQTLLLSSQFGFHINP